MERSRHQDRRRRGGSRKRSSASSLLFLLLAVAAVVAAPVLAKKTTTTSPSSLPQQSKSKSFLAAKNGASSEISSPEVAAEMEQAAGAAAAGPAKVAGNLVTRRDGTPFFMLGVNLGNVKFLPFSKATQYSHSPAELQAILDGALRDISAAGGNTVRFWLHIDGSSSPEWDAATGLASSVSPETLRDLKWFLQRARDYKLEVILSLWSHDILAVRRCNPPATRDRALRIWEDPAATDAYIQRALLPMMADLGASKMTDGRSFLQGGVFTWEIANEPEEACEELEFNTNYQYKVARGEYSYSNPSTFNNDPRRKVDYQDISFMKKDMQRVDPSDSSQAIYNGDYFLKTWQGKDFFNWYLYHDVFGQFNSDYYYLLDQVKNHGLYTKGIKSAFNIQRTVNKIAGAIHRADPGARVTVGSDSTSWISDRQLTLQPWRPKNRNLYSDRALVAAGGDPLGTLDYYQVHCYPDWSDPNVNEFDRDKVVFHRDKSHWGLDKPLLAGEFWDAVAGGPQGRNPLTPEAWYGLGAKGYAGGLGWAWFDVREQAGVAVASPWRYVVKHAMQDHWVALMREVRNKMDNPSGYAFKSLKLYPNVGTEGAASSSNDDVASEAGSAAAAAYAQNGTLPSSSTAAGAAGAAPIAPPDVGFVSAVEDAAAARLKAAAAAKQAKEEAAAASAQRAAAQARDTRVLAVVVPRDTSTGEEVPEEAVALTASDVEMLVAERVTEEAERAAGGGVEKEAEAAEGEEDGLLEVLQAVAEVAAATTTAAVAPSAGDRAPPLSSSFWGVPSPRGPSWTRVFGSSDSPAEVFGTEADAYGFDAEAWGPNGA